MSKSISRDEIKCPKCGYKYADRIGYNFRNDEVYECNCGTTFGVSIIEVLEEIYEIDV